MHRIKNFTNFPEDWAQFDLIGVASKTFVIGRRENGGMVICRNPYAPAPTWRRLPGLIECPSLLVALDIFKAGL